LHPPMLAGDLHTQLVAAGARLAAAGLVRASEGNLSARTGGRHCLVTPTGGVTGRLRGADLVEVPIDRGEVSRRASSEVRMHIEIYRRRPDVEAIVHAHPPWVLRLAREGKLPDPTFFEEDGCWLGVVVDVPHFEEGSAALATSAAAALESSSACVLLDHGAVTVGATIGDALRRMLALERAAARSAGA
jgi:L-fuculose-phosphate aldolase